MAGLRLPAAQLNFPPPDPAPSLCLGLTPCTQLVPKLHLGVSFRRTQCTTRRGIEMDPSPAGCDKAPLGAGTHSSLEVHLLQQSLAWIRQEGTRDQAAPAQYPTCCQDPAGKSWGLAMCVGTSRWLSPPDSSEPSTPAGFAHPSLGRAAPAPQLKQNSEASPQTPPDNICPCQDIHPPSLPLGQQPGVSCSIIQLGTAASGSSRTLKNEGTDGWSCQELGEHGQPQGLL